MHAGASNAAPCATLATRERDAEVVVLERAPRGFAAGTPLSPHGAMRVTYHGVKDLRRLMPKLSDEKVAMTDFGSCPV